LALEVLHAEKRPTVELSDVVGLHHVGVVQPSREPRLLQKQLAHHGLLHEALVEPLYHDELLEALEARDDREEYVSIGDP
jgi:hypothetical protein